MGYAVIMFVVLLLLSVSIALSANYGMSKDSQEAPLLAENAYAEREGGKMQTGITIVNTCFSGSGLYTTGSGGYGPYTLNLTVKNNGSIVLNPNKSTIFYNTSYVSFNVITGQVWTPLTNSTMLAPNIFIYSSDMNYPLRLEAVTNNGIKAIAPTSPSNFWGETNGNESYSFGWTHSTDDDGIAYYLLYKSNSNGFSGQCPDPNLINITILPGNINSTFYPSPCTPPCPVASFFLTAVDNIGNMGIQSMTVYCWPQTTDKPCVK